MTDEGASDFNIMTLAAATVSAYVSCNNVPVGELPALIQHVYDQFRSLGQPAEPEAEPLVPPVPIKKTVTPDHIISLEDGKPYKTLKRHLAIRGLTPEEYRYKWGLPSDYPMVAASYTTQRSELAKANGLGKSPQKR
ncbi:MucR family transcriptional regulator [Methylobacterium sp. ID0610]|uniref:MucR family transcriptional regulator n=1 Tax=Methylobacterium carpenticola TaxID=3344827 RepID=UPI00369A060C